MPSDANSDDNSLFLSDPNDPPSVHPGKGLTLVDATNGFNELKCMAMRWTVQHLWSNGSCFAFDCYCHDVMLMIRSPGHNVTILWSCKGITQGNPLSMILYRLALLLLVRYLCASCPKVMQPCYANDLALLACHHLNARCLKILTMMNLFF